MKSKVQAAPAAYSPVVLPVGGSGVFCIAQNTSLTARQELASLLLEGLEGTLNDFAITDTRPSTTACWGMTYLASTAKGLLDSMNLPGEQA